MAGHSGNIYDESVEIKDGYKYLLFEKSGVGIVRADGVAITELSECRLLKLDASGNIVDSVGLYEDASGNIGIRTMNPGYSLDVNGDSKIVNQLGVGTNPTSAGITINPLGDALHGLAIVRNSASGRSQISLQDEGGSEYWRIGMTGAGSTDFGFYDQTQNALFLEQNGDILMNPGGNVGIGDVDPDFKTDINGTIGLKEQAAAAADVAGKGQIWVKNTTPNELYFTDDAGTDTQISPHPLDAPDSLYINGPGLDMIDKRVQHYLGMIFWTPLATGVLTEETFEEYNERRKNVPGHIDLVKKDWYADQKEAEIKKRLKEEIEIYESEAKEQVAIFENVKTKEAITAKQLDETTGQIIDKEVEKEKINKVDTGKKKWQLKAGVRLDSETGKFYRQKTREEIEKEIKNIKLEDPPEWIKNKMKAK